MYQLQPVSLLEEEEGSEGVDLLPTCEQETKPALCTWPRSFPSRPAQGGHGAQRAEMMEDQGLAPGAGNAPESCGLSEPGVGAPLQKQPVVTSRRFLGPG